MLAYPGGAILVCLIPAHVDPPIGIHGGTVINEEIIQNLPSD